MTSRRVAAVLVGLALAPACGTGRGGTPAAGLAALGACDRDEVYGAPADEFVSSPGAWLKVRSIDLTSAGDPTLATTESFRGTYDVVGGDASAVSAIGADSVGTLTMHGGIARDVQQALAQTPDVFAHVGGGDDVTRLDYALALTPTDFAFLGECQSRLLTNPLRDTFGADAQATVTGFVGKSGGEIAAAFPAPVPPAAAVSILNPETAPKELLASLRTVRFTLPTRPAGWVGPYAICTRIAQGWSDCLDLSRATSASHAADAYYDPKNPTLEVWLVNGDADLSRPLAKLSTVDLSALSASSRVDLGLDGLRLVGTLSSASSAATAAADPHAAAAAFSGFGLSVP